MSTYKKMNSDLKEKWLKALRSKRYKQTQQQLRNTVKKIGPKGGNSYEYCCLGVLCAVTGGGKWVQDSYIYNGTRDGGNIPRPLREELGISKAVENKLVSMNDDKDSNFEQIANWIERNI